MAEIHIEKKRKPIWPWIFGLLLIMGGIWFAIESSNDHSPTFNPSPVVSSDTASHDQQSDLSESEEIEEFVIFVNENKDSEETGLDHAFTAEGIRLLSSALVNITNKVNPQNGELQQKNQELQKKADQIQRDQSSTQHVDTIKSAFNAAVGIMDDLQKNHFPDLKEQVAQVKNKSEDIDPNTLTLEQKEKIKAFFSSSSEALQAMNDKIEKP